MDMTSKKYSKRVEAYYRHCTLEYLIKYYYIEGNSREPGILERVVKDKLLKNKKEKANMRKRIKDHLRMFPSLKGANANKRKS